MPIAMINGVDIYYEIHGKGVPIIFVHPPLLNSMNFTYQIQKLSNQFKTIVFDIRGHGKSQYSKIDLTYPLLVEDIRQLMDYLEIEKAYLCGYSTGGSIALEFLLSYPERSLGAILVGGISEVHDLRLKGLILMGCMLAKVGAIPFLALSVAWNNSNSLQLFWNMYKMAKRGNPKNIEQYYRFSLHYNCTSRLSTINRPVLLIYGAKDKQFHSYARLLDHYLPNSELIFIQNVTHQIPTKAAHELNHLITRFIKKHGTSDVETGHLLSEIRGKS